MRASSRRPRRNAGFVRQYEVPHLDSRCLRTGLREVSGGEARRRPIGVGGHLRDLAVATGLGRARRAGSLDIVTGRAGPRCPVLRPFSLPAHRRQPVSRRLHRQVRRPGSTFNGFADGEIVGVVRRGLLRSSTAPSPSPGGRASGSTSISDYGTDHLEVVIEAAGVVGSDQAGDPARPSGRPCGALRACARRRRDRHCEALTGMPAPSTSPWRSAHPGRRGATRCGRSPQATLPWAACTRELA